MSLFQRLVDRSRLPVGLTASYRRFRDVRELPDPGAVVEILDLDLPLVADTPRDALALLEERGTDDTTDDPWRTFKWRLLAFCSLVDALGAPLAADMSRSSPFRLWYFYFESKYILIEALLAGLTGYQAASTALLRPFLEFSLIQNFYRRAIDRDDSYKAVEKYFTDKRLPSWHRLTMDAVPPTKLGATVRFRAQSHLSALSESSAHAYAPLHSPKVLGALRPELTLDGLFGWQAISMVLEAALWLYYVNTPALFSPCDLMRAFGCNPPVGLVVDHQLAHIVERTLAPVDYRAFVEDANTRNTGIRDFIATRPQMSDEEVLGSWDSQSDHHPSTPEQAFCATMAHLRATKEVLAWEQPTDPGDAAFASMRLDSLTWWQRIQRGKR